MKIIADDRCLLYSKPAHPERPARVGAVVAHLRSQTRLPLEWVAASEAPETCLLRAHSPEHLDRVRRPNGDFDPDTPAYPDIFEHACRSAGGALQAMRLARAGERSFSLLRPPGHHASVERVSGFCYFNSVAVAALTALAEGVQRVAVLDFDVHHGNGTEDILCYRPGVAFFSVHQFPSYPGTGGAHVGDNCFNYPLEPNSPRQDYLRLLSRALEELKRFEPDLLAISAGFDGYAGDPVGEEALEVEDYGWLGRQIRALGVPAFGLLEGGYSDELPALVLAYLAGLEGR